MSEIDWKGKIANSASTPNLEERRKLQLADEAVRLAKDFGIEELLSTLKEQVLKEGEIISPKSIDLSNYALSNYLRVPIGCWTSVTLRYPAEIHIASDYGFPELSCKGHLSLDVEVYAGFEDINGKLSFEGNVNTYLRSNQLKKEGAIRTSYSLGPDQNPEHPVLSEVDQLFSASFDRDNFSIEEIKEELANTLARFLASHNLRYAELRYVSPPSHGPWPEGA